MTAAPNPKGKRPTVPTLTTGNGSKEVLGATTDSNGNGNSPDVGIDWLSLDTSLLHSYRHAHRLNLPCAFGSASNQAILSAPGVGRCSPTMARHKDRRRVSKEHLALAVRKDFNAAVAHESEILTEFLYVVKNQDKKFRLRFAPTPSK